jgi:hypothetical protein
MPATMPTRAVLAAAALIAIAGVGLAVSRRSAASRADRGFDPDYRFGEVVQGTPVEHTFRVRNDDRDELRIKRLGTSFGLTVDGVDSVIPAGRTGDIRLRVDTKGRRGSVVEFANVYSTADSLRPFARLRMTGSIVLPLQLSPQDRVYFFSTRGAPEQREIMVTNHLSTPLTIRSATSSNPVFSVRQQTLEAGKRYKLTVALDPNAPAGRHEGTITLATNQPAYASVPIKALAIVNDVVSTSPKVVAFSSILMESADAPVVGRKEVVVRKQGGTDFKVLRAATDVPFLAVEVKPGRRPNDFVVHVRIVKSRAKRGDFGGTLTIETNDPAFPQLKLPITGKLV